MEANELVRMTQFDMPSKEAHCWRMTNVFPEQMQLSGPGQQLLDKMLIIPDLLHPQKLSPDCALMLGKQSTY